MVYTTADSDLKAWCGDVLVLAERAKLWKSLEICGEVYCQRKESLHNNEIGPFS